MKPFDGLEEFLGAFAPPVTPRLLYQRLMAREKKLPPKRQDQKPAFRINYAEGPMGFLLSHIVKRMAAAGWPATVHALYRSPAEQNAAKARGASKASAYHSPHQFYEAGDVVHKTLFWDAPQEFWDTLAIVSRQVANDFGVPLELGYDWGWDSAHVEIKGWREVRRRQKVTHTPTKLELDLRFKELLPKQFETRLSQKGSF